MLIGSNKDLTANSWYRRYKGGTSWESMMKGKKADMTDLTLKGTDTGHSGAVRHGARMADHRLEKLG